MKICSKCNNELIDDLEVNAQGVYEVAISYKNRTLGNQRGKVKSTLCPKCGDVAFYLDQEAIDIVMKDIPK